MKDWVIHNKNISIHDIDYNKSIELVKVVVSAYNENLLFEIILVCVDGLNEKAAMTSTESK